VHHGTIDWLIGSMVKAVHTLPGTAVGSITGHGQSEPDKWACLSLPAPERALTLTLESDKRTTQWTGIAPPPGTLVCG
jgi:hypothetical protein